MTKPSTMTVAVLRAELEKRDLDTSGLKAVLTERLQTALGPDETPFAPPAKKAKTTPAAPKDTTSATGPLAGRNVVVTGTMEPGMLRKDAEAKTTAAGVTYLKTVTKACDLLVFAEGAGLKKREAADKAGIPVISGARFLRICAGEEDAPPA